MELLSIDEGLVRLRLPIQRAQRFGGQVLRTVVEEAVYSAAPGHHRPVD